MGPAGGGFVVGGNATASRKAVGPAGGGPLIGGNATATRKAVGATNTPAPASGARKDVKAQAKTSPQAPDLNQGF